MIEANAKFLNEINGVALNFKAEGSIYDMLLECETIVHRFLYNITKNADCIERKEIIEGFITNVCKNLMEEDKNE